MWLVHQWLAAQPSLSTDATVTNLCNRLVRLTAGSGIAFTERELCWTLPILIRCVDGGTDGEAVVEQLSRRVFDRRLRSLGAILLLAGVMAADPRRVPAVVVDHVGIGGEVQISALHAAAVKASWQCTGDTLTLHAVCDHPALLAAFTDLVERTARARQWIDHLDVAPELTNALPARYSDKGLRPENHEGSPVFDTPLLRFRLSDEKVRELLMGRQLYGEPDLAIRELYQNALDACRYRHMRRRYRQRQGGTTTDWIGAISFRQGTDADGREFIECTDNGVGMGRDTLMSTFANAGERFVYKSDFRAEQARWQELDPPLQLVPNSQFGIGVFSYFMIAEEIYIVTRPVNEDDLVEPQAHSVRIASSGSLFQITPSTDMPAGGTRIRLYLTGEDRLSVVRTLRRLLWIAEYAVTAEEGGSSRETWRPEKLRYPDAIVEPLQYRDDLWWVAGEGLLAADGIRTNEEQYGLVVNLRGPRRPQFTVDRNRLRYWDKEWIREQIQGSLAVLQNWPGLTLSWLWSVTETTPSIAEDVFTWLLTHEHELAVEESWGLATAPVKRVGCLPTDRELFTGEMFTWFDPTSRAWLTAWRVGIWKGISHFVGAERIPEATRLDGFPVVHPLDANILSGIYMRGRSRGPSRWGQPTVDELLKIVADPDEPPNVRLRRIRRYAITGLDLRAARRIPPIGHVFTTLGERLTENTEEEGLLSAVAAWSPPDAEPRLAVGLCLATASATLRIPLGEVVRRAAALVPDSWTLSIDGDLGDLGDHVFTWSEADLFAEQSYRWSPAIGPVISPAQIVQFSSKLGQPTSQVLKMFARFAPLGYSVAGRELYPADLTRVEQGALRYAEKLGYELAPIHLLLLAGQAGTTVEQIYEDLHRIAEMGFINLPTATPQIDIITDDEQVIIANELNVFDERSSRYVVATRWLAVRQLIQNIGGRDFHDFDKRLSRRRRLLDVVDLHRPITAPEIVDLAWGLDYSIAAAIDYYRFLYPATADLSCLPDARDAWTSLYPRREEKIALLGASAQRYRVHDVSWALRCGDIVNGAWKAGQTIASFLDRLEPYRSLGAPLPELTQPERNLLSVHPVDRYDQSILAKVDRYGRTTFVDTVDALRLVQVAGRLGWTPSETHARIAPWQPLGLKLNYLPGACFNDIVSWQDLLLVTEYLDGQGPVITGRVSAVHLRACAAEIDESVEQVLARLCPYAPLFDLELDQEVADVR